MSVSRDRVSSRGLMETDTIIEVADLEALDFSFAQPCEHINHGKTHKDEPAMFLLAKKSCPVCGRPASQYFQCLSGWELMAKGVVCSGCNTVGERDDRLTIVRVIGK